MEMTVSELASACAAEAPSGMAEEQVLTGLTTDSRAVEPGQIFLALQGDKFDGHDYAAAAVKAGAAVIVVSRPLEGLDDKQILVPDTLVALGQIAHHWRSKLSAKVIAVTGSAGKSTTKDLLAAICEQAGPTVATIATENNEIGVPKTLLRVAPEDRFCVVEFGMRGRGQIRQLTEMAGPEIGIITCIGEAHVGLLGSREAIAESKAEMLPLLPFDGVAVLPADDFFYPLLRGMCKCRVISFGEAQDAEVRVLEVLEETLTATWARVQVGKEQVELTVPLPGRYNLSNALAAAAGALALGCTIGQIKVGIESYTGLQMRGEIISGPYGSTIINDAYNAHPTSMAAALQMLRNAPGRKIVVFGDMLELGDTAAAAHAKVGELAAEAGVELLVTVGEMAALAAETARARGVEVRMANTPEEAAEALHPRLREADTVLVKASRGTQLERTVKGLLHAE
ncbi:MAG: UDP-N-acetylmuramoyl-tripeptide--D-alanyl-D-alanine ligase [Armatimonadota bacterium]